MNDKRGIAIYIAVVVTAALVLVSYAVISLAIKEIGTSSAGRDSQGAFYAADSGVECAIYWDLKALRISAFSTTTPSASISCVGNSSIPISTTVDNSGGVNNGTGTSTFQFQFPSPSDYCAIVNVVKSYAFDIATGLILPKTKIESRGYNSCIAANTRRVERAILVNY